MDADAKKQKKALNSLLRLIYERELRKELFLVGKQFDRWMQNEIDSFGLSDEIHKFHDGVARELFARYEDCRTWAMVGRALDLGLLQMDEVSADFKELAKEVLKDWRPSQKS